MIKLETMLLDIFSSDALIVQPISFIYNFKYSYATICLILGTYYILMKRHVNFKKVTSLPPIDWLAAKRPKKAPAAANIERVNDGQEGNDVNPLSSSICKKISASNVFSQVTFKKDSVPADSAPGGLVSSNLVQNIIFDFDSTLLTKESQELLVLAKLKQSSLFQLASFAARVVKLFIWSYWNNGVDFNWLDENLENGGEMAFIPALFRRLEITKRDFDEFAHNYGLQHVKRIDDSSVANQNADIIYDGEILIEKEMRNLVTYLHGFKNKECTDQQMNSTTNTTDNTLEVFVMSNGLYDIVVPWAESFFSIPERNVGAVKFNWGNKPVKEGLSDNFNNFDSLQCLSVDTSNGFSRGKAFGIDVSFRNKHECFGTHPRDYTSAGFKNTDSADSSSDFIRNAVQIGDSMTDLRMFKERKAEYFIAFCKWKPKFEKKVRAQFEHMEKDLGLDTNKIFFAYDTDELAKVLFGAEEGERLFKAWSSCESDDVSTSTKTCGVYIERGESVKKMAGA